MTALRRRSLAEWLTNLIPPGAVCRNVACNRLAEDRLEPSESMRHLFEDHDRLEYMCGPCSDTYFTVNQFSQNRWRRTASTRGKPNE